MDGQMDKEDVAYIHNGIFYRLKKEGILSYPPTHMMRSCEHTARWVVATHQARKRRLTMKLLASTSILDFTASRTMRNKILLLKPLSLWHLLWQPQLTKTGEVKNQTQIFNLDSWGKRQ